MSIHCTAVVDKRCEVDPTAEIGPYAVVEPDVTIGPGCRLFAHAYISSGTTLGARVQVHPFAIVGHHPQDLAWKEAPSYTRIDDDTVVREHASVHRGTKPESTTVVGKRCFIMATAHLGHNCVLGDDVKLANGALVAGYVEIGRGSFLSGHALVHQFCRIGELVMIHGGERVTSDVLPYLTVAPQGVIGPNVVGLRRAEFSADARAEVRAAYKLLFRSGLGFRDALSRLRETVRTDAGRRMLEFASAPSKRGFMRFHPDRARADDYDELNE